MLNVPTLPPTLPHLLPPHTVDANFQEGFQKGVESFTDDWLSGITLTSIDDVWHFLQSEISPQAVAAEGGIEAFLGIPGTRGYIPAAERVGFVVGYLMTAFTHREEVQHE